MTDSPKPWTLCIDVGGSKIKFAVCDRIGVEVRGGTKRDTPHPSDPATVLSLIESVVPRLPDFDRVSVGFPAVVRRGVTTQAVNLENGWAGCPLEEEITRRLDRPARVANDADVQGLGSVAGNGVELVITLGTGLGSGLFLDGQLVPNVELGHMPYRDGRSFEQELGKQALHSLGVERWRTRIPGVLATFRAAFSFDTLYIGGGNARHLVNQDQIQLPRNVVCVRNEAGLTGGVALWDGIPEDRVVPILTQVTEE